MGLYVKAYKGIKRLDSLVADECGSPQGVMTLYLEVNPDFLVRADGITNGLYSYEDAYGFRAGTYGNYNLWRDRLASITGYGSAWGAWRVESGPFWELINFSDCEGLLGPETCKKLLADFRAYERRADMVDDWFFELYQDFLKAFALAAAGGCVVFV